ncbi:MAG: 1-acyl-sn-glycerol-3-phosphate acyltransferase, partial [Nostoc sp.]
VAVSGNYIRENPTIERFAEMTLILWQMSAKIKGDKAVRRPQLGKQKVKITVGEPISISERYSAYQGNRLAARQAVAEVTNDLQHALEGLI